MPAQTVTTGSLEWHERWANYIQRTYRWRQIGIVPAETAFDQTFQLHHWGRPFYCFPHQFGGARARRTARTTIELGAGGLFREDIRKRVLVGQTLRVDEAHFCRVEDVRQYLRHAGWGSPDYPLRLIFDDFGRLVFFFRLAFR